MNEPSKLRILVVDDEEDLRSTLSKMLRKAGYEVVTTANGEEADDLLKDERFSLAIVDIWMPDWTGSKSTRAGIHLLQKIVTEFPATKVIMLTAHATVENAVESLKLGASDFVEKGKSSHDFLGVVSRVLSTASSPRPPNRDKGNPSRTESGGLRKGIAWTKNRLIGGLDELIASVLAAIAMYVFGVLTQLLPLEPRAWLSNPSALMYLAISGGILVGLIVGYMIWRRRA